MTSVFRRRRCALSDDDLRLARDMLRDDTITVTSVARYMGVSRGTIYRHLPEASGRPIVRRRKLSDDDIRLARDMLNDETITVAAVASYMGVCIATLYRYLPATPGKRRGGLSDADLSKARDMLKDKNITLAAVASHMGVSRMTIYRRLPTPRPSVTRKAR